MNDDSREAQNSLYGCANLHKYCHHYTDGNKEHIGCKSASDDMGAPCMFLSPGGACRVIVQVLDGIYD